MTSYQRKELHRLAHFLLLRSRTFEEGSERFVVVFKQDANFLGDDVL
jgi:hypothetical protein